ncbi:methyltransferase family protein [Candidatus Neomarinimicrobiota bacterium]
MKQKHFIDSHKGITGVAILAMMALYHQWANPTAWIYLALHGTYGLLWVMKSRIFPDKTWEQQTGWGYGLYIWGGLTLYWVAPWLLTSRGVQAPAWYLGVCISTYIFGVFLHFATDMQKYVSLQLRPAALITSGMMGRCRNLNYFGELLIYLGFGLLAMHWVPLAILGLFIVVIWLPNMRRKDRSLLRYPEFENYKLNTRLFIPFII